MAITATTSEVESNDISLPSTLDTISNWMGDKAKYACEAIGNFSIYISRIPTFYGHGSSPFWSGVESGMKDCKKILAFPGAIKGSISLYEKIKKGGESVRNLLGDVSYIFSDTLDGLQGFNAFGFMGKCSGPIVDRLKDLSGIYGLGNTSYNLTVDMQRLRQIDLNKVVHPEIQDPKKALELKNNWINAEISNKWHDRLRCMSAVAMCTLGIAGAAVVAFAAPWVAMSWTFYAPWMFAALGTVGVYGKFHMYAAKAEGGFWQNRYAELIPTVKSTQSASVN